MVLYKIVVVVKLPFKSQIKNKEKTQEISKLSLVTEEEFCVGTKPKVL